MDEVKRIRREAKKDYTLRVKYSKEKALIRSKARECIRVAELSHKNQVKKYRAEEELAIAALDKRFMRDAHAQRLGLVGGLPDAQ